MVKGKLLFAYYPFLKGSKTFLAETGIRFDQFLEDELFLSAREQGLKRVESAIEERTIPEPSLSADRDVLFEILSYILGRLIVAHIGIDSLTRLYALAEATYYQKRLETEEDTDFLLDLLNEIGLDVSQRGGQRSIPVFAEDLEQGSDDGGFSVPFNRYLKCTKRMRDPHWKLINQPMERGQVYINKRRLLRLSRELLFDKFFEEIQHLATPATMNPVFEKNIKRLKNRYMLLKEELKADELGEVAIENIPPCMRSILSFIQSGENVAHAGRFALTAFLHMIGLSNEEILQFNKSSPDFDEKIARYQVDHITGTISTTEYTPQSCKTMVSLGLCVSKDILCSKIGHPLSYYDAKNEKKKPAEIRLKLLTDFLARYFAARRGPEIEGFLKEKNDSTLREHIKTTLQNSPLFRAVSSQKKGKGKEKEASQDKLLPHVKGLGEVYTDRWCVLELDLSHAARDERGYIKRLRMGEGSGEHMLLYSELKGSDDRYGKARILPTIDMALSMTILLRAEKKKTVVCCSLPLFGKHYVYVDSLE